MIAACGQWFSPAYRNVCLRCKKSGRIVSVTGLDRGMCRCCQGEGWHATFHQTASRPFPAFWQRGTLDA